MTNILSPIIASSAVKAEQQKQQQSQAASAVDFDALLFSAGVKSGFAVSGGNDPLLGFVDAFVDKINNAMRKQFSANAPLAPHTFPFSAAFEATFGLTGPLPDFINVMTAGLRLTATQNQAFQDIAIKHKDIVKTPESVREVAKDLERAGIQYSSKPYAAA